jgi:hypothetical protein
MREAILAHSGEALSSRQSFEAGGPAFERFLNFRVAHPSPPFEGSEGLIFPSALGASIDRVNSDQTVFEFRIERKNLQGQSFG